MYTENHFFSATLHTDLWSGGWGEAGLALHSVWLLLHNDFFWKSHVKLSIRQASVISNLSSSLDQSGLFTQLAIWFPSLTVRKEPNPPRHSLFHFFFYTNVLFNYHRLLFQIKSANRNFTWKSIASVSPQPSVPLSSLCVPLCLL